MSGAAVPVTKIRRTRSMTTVTPGASTTSGKTIASASTKPHTALSKLHVTAVQLKDPANQARILNQIQANSVQAAAGANTNPMNAGGVIIPHLSWTAGTAKLVLHNLGREPVGYAILRSTATATAAGSASVAAGSIYNSFADAKTLSVTSNSATIFFVVPYSHAGLSAGTTLTAASGTIKVTNAGTYVISWNGTVSCATGSVTFDFALFVNGVQQADGEGAYLSTAQATASWSTIKALNAGDVIDCRVSGASGVNPAPYTLNLVACNLSAYSVQTAGGGSAPQGIVLTEATLPAGYDVSMALNLVPSATGTGDLVVF